MQGNSAAGGGNVGFNFAAANADKAEAAVRQH
jgi:hypothetical protein